MSNKHIMKQAQKLQAQMAKLQEDLGNLVVEASTGGGAVTVTMSGQQQLLTVTISPEIVDANDVEMLQDMVLTAVNEAIVKSQEAAAKQMSGLTGGLNIPGLM